MVSSIDSLNDKHSVKGFFDSFFVIMRASADLEKIEGSRNEK